jgi:hypothetical protein
MAVHALEWVLLLSLATSGLCLLSLVTMMIVGRLRHEVRQWRRNRRHDVVQRNPLSFTEGAAAGD